MPNVTAVILAGGLGTRLRSVVSNLPKCLAEVNGKPFIYYILDQIVDAGIKDVVLAVDYKWEMIYEIVGINYKNLSMAYSVDDIKQGSTGTALRSALFYISDSTVLVMNGDTYVDMELSHFLWECQRGDLGTGFVLNVNNGIINMGIYLTCCDFVQTHISLDKLYSLEKSFLNDVYKYGVIPYTINKPFIDIGTPESYAKAGEFMRKIGK